MERRENLKYAENVEKFKGLDFLREEIDGPVVVAPGGKLEGLLKKHHEVFEDLQFRGETLGGIMIRCLLISFPLSFFVYPLFGYHMLPSFLVVFILSVVFLAILRSSSIKKLADIHSQMREELQNQLDSKLLH